MDLLGSIEGEKLARILREKARTCTRGRGGDVAPGGSDGGAHRHSRPGTWLVATRNTYHHRDIRQEREARRLIKESMTTRVATVSMDGRHDVIRAIVAQAHFRHLLVLEEEEQVGGLSDRDPQPQPWHGRRDEPR